MTRLRRNKTLWSVFGGRGRAHLRPIKCWKESVEVTRALTDRTITVTTAGVRAPGRSGRPPALPFASLSSLGPVARHTVGAGQSAPEAGSLSGSDTWEQVVGEAGGRGLRRTEGEESGREAGRGCGLAGLGAQSGVCGAPPPRCWAGPATAGPRRPPGLQGAKRGLARGTAPQIRHSPEKPGGTVNAWKS